MDNFFGSLIASVMINHTSDMFLQDKYTFAAVKVKNTGGS